MSVPVTGIDDAPTLVVINGPIASGKNAVLAAVEADLLAGQRRADAPHVLIDVSGRESTRDPLDRPLMLLEDERGSSQVGIGHEAKENAPTLEPVGKGAQHVSRIDPQRKARDQRVERVRALSVERVRPPSREDQLDPLRLTPKAERDVAADERDGPAFACGDASPRVIVETDQESDQLGDAAR